MTGLFFLRLRRAIADDERIAVTGSREFLLKILRVTSGETLADPHLSFNPFALLSYTITGSSSSLDSLRFRSDASSSRLKDAT